jgi:hypothetical protein
MFGEGRRYFDVPQNQRNIVDMTERGLAAGFHYLTTISESILGDAVRVFQRPENRVPLEGYGNRSAPRLSLDIKEGVASVKNAFRGSVISLLNLPIIATKAVGDGIADGFDHVAGVR